MIYISTINFFSEQQILNLFNEFSCYEFFRSNCCFLITDNSSSIDLQVFDSIVNKLQIKVIKPGSNLGFGEGHNLAFKEANIIETDRFVIINNDIQVNDFNEIIHLIINTNDFEITSPTIVSNGKTWFAGARFSPITKDIKFEEKSLKVKGSDFITGCFMVMTGRTYQLLGGFDKEFFMYAEDLDLSIKATNKSVQLLVYPCTIEHAVGSGQDGTYSYVYLFHNSRNRIIIACRYFGWVPILYHVIKYSLLRTLQLLLMFDFKGIAVANYGVFSGILKCKKF